MSKTVDALKLPASIKTAAARLAEQDGVSLNVWIASAVAQKVGAVETAEAFFKHRSKGRSPGELDAVLARVPDRPPALRDALPPKAAAPVPNGR